MPYLNVDLAFFTHRKTIRLVGLLGRGAEVLPIKLWSYCGMHHAESGKLTSYGSEEIESVVGWWGEKGRAVEAMLTVCFLERDDSGNFQVHDWFEHAGHLAAFKKRAKSAAKKRWAKYASSISKRGGKQSPSRGKVGKDRSLKSYSSEGGLGETKAAEWPCPKLLIEKYNTETPNELSAVEKITPARIAKANTYLKIFPQVEFWTETFAEIHKSQFLRGLRSSNGHGSFKADFDWLLTKGKDGTENAAKVWEGKYRDGA